MKNGHKIRGKKFFFSKFIIHGYHSNRIIVKIIQNCCINISATTHSYTKKLGKYTLGLS